MEFLKRMWGRFHHHFVPSERNEFRPHSLRRDFLLSVVALTCVVEGFLVTSLYLQSSYREYAAAVLQSALVSLTNSERAGYALEGLSEDPRLSLAAQAKADDMAAKGYFAHVDPNGKEAWDWMKEAGYDYAYAGENLATQFFDSTDVVNAWMSSPTHRANVLRPTYKNIGIGIAYGVHQGQNTAFIVQLFGTTKESLGLKPQTTGPAVVVETTSQSAGPSVAGIQITEEPQQQGEELQSPSIVEVVAPEIKDAALAAPAQSSVSSPNTIARILSSPRTITFFALSILVAILSMAVIFAAVIRIRVQPVDLLLNGMVVVAFILTLIAFNSHFFGTVEFSGEPAAAVESFEIPR